MAQSSWLKKYLTMKPEVAKIFEDLENYRNFCVDFGYKFNEADLYNDKSEYGEYLRFVKGKSVRDNWTSTKINRHKGPIQ